MPRFEDFESENGDENEFETSSQPKGVSDWIKRIVATGVGSVFMTEDGIRSALNELRLPREILTSIIEQAEKSKKEIVGIVGVELKNLLNKVDARDLLMGLLSQATIEIDAKIRIVPNEKKAKKDDEAQEKPRRSKKATTDS